MLVSAHTYMWRLITKFIVCIKMGIHLLGALYISWSVGYYFCFVIVTLIVENCTQVTDLLAEVVVLLTCV